jgi:transposase
MKLHEQAEYREMNIIGIDVSKLKLDCAWLKESNKIKAKAVANSPEGWQQLVAWAQTNTGSEIGGLHFVMEATGIYHENLAAWLYDNGANVSVVNPAHVKHYAQSLGVQAKNDKKDSAVLARYGQREQPSLWQPAPAEVRTLKALLSRLAAVEKDLQREKNRQEKAIVADTPDTVLKSITHMIGLFEAEQAALEKLIDEHIKKHKKLKDNKVLLESIPGVGKVVSRQMLMVLESHQFASASQCAAYLGLVPVQKESGSSLKARPQLAKNGNPRIRAKLYMATVTATRHNPDIKAQYERLTGKGKSKMSALGAAMRKLVQICYGVIKHQQPYQPQVA